MLEEIIGKVNVAEQTAEKAVKDSYERSYQIIQDSKLQAEKVIEDANLKAKAILKNKIDEAMSVAQAQTNDILHAGQLLADKIYQDCKANLEKASDFIVKYITG